MSAARPRFHRPALRVLVVAVVLASGIGLAACSSADGLADDEQQAWRDQVSTFAAYDDRFQETLDWANDEVVDAPNQDVQDQSKVDELSAAIHDGQRFYDEVLVEVAKVTTPVTKSELIGRMAQANSAEAQYWDLGMRIYNGVLALWNVEGAGAGAVVPSAESGTATPLSPSVALTTAVPSSDKQPSLAALSSSAPSLVAQPLPALPGDPLTHDATMSGGFIVFGGWATIIDNEVPKGTFGHTIKLAFGGIGVGGFGGRTQLHLGDERTQLPNGVDLWGWFHEQVHSCQISTYVAGTGFTFYDRGSRPIGSIAAFGLGLTRGGGSVKVGS